MHQAGYMVAVAAAERSHGRHAVGFWFIRQVVRRSAGRYFAVNHFAAAFFRQFNAFAHMTDDFVEQEDNGGTEFLGKVNGFNHHFIGFFNRCRRKHENAMIPMSAPAGLHDIALRRRGGQTGTGTGTLHVHDHYRQFRHGGVADEFLL